MNIIKWHMEGGLWYMLILSLLFLGMFVLFVRYLILHHKHTGKHWTGSVIQQIGLFCFFFGLFIQITGLIQAFDAIEAAGDISPGLLAGGLKISFFPTAYGLLILLFSRVLYFYITRIQAHQSANQSSAG